MHDSDTKIPSLQTMLQNARLLLACSALVVSLPAQLTSAHPVVFEQGTAIMGHHHGDMAGVEVIHSPRWWYGIGLDAERTESSSTILARANALVWRGNFPDLQSNLYLGVAAGVAWGTLSDHTSQKSETEARIEGSSHKNERSGVQSWSVEWDAEDRQYYAKARHEQFFKNEQLFTNETVARLGIAPYKAQADEPTLWTMVEWQVHSNAKLENPHHEVTPLIRYFYRNMLFEVGSSLTGKLKFNYMIHYF
jgi:hypothetical protein